MIMSIARDFNYSSTPFKTTFPNLKIEIMYLRNESGDGSISTLKKLRLLFFIWKALRLWNNSMQSSCIGEKKSYK